MFVNIPFPSDGLGKYKDPIETTSMMESTWDFSSVFQFSGLRWLVMFDVWGPKTQLW